MGAPGSDEASLGHLDREGARGRPRPSLADQAFPVEPEEIDLVREGRQVVREELIREGAELYSEGGWRRRWVLEAEQMTEGQIEGLIKRNREVLAERMEEMAKGRANNLAPETWRKAMGDERLPPLDIIASDDPKANAQALLEYMVRHELIQGVGREREASPARSDPDAQDAWEGAPAQGDVVYALQGRFNKERRCKVLDLELKPQGPMARLQTLVSGGKQVFWAPVEQLRWTAREYKIAMVWGRSEDNKVRRARREYSARYPNPRVAKDDKYLEQYMPRVSEWAGGTTS